MEFQEKLKICTIIIALPNNRRPDFRRLIRGVLLRKLGVFMKKPFDPDSEFIITVHFSHSETEEEPQFLMSQEPPKKKRKKSKKSSSDIFEQLTDKLDNISTDVFKSYLKANNKLLTSFRKYPVPPKHVSQVVNIRTECKHHAVFFAGNYTKYLRGLAQTKWILNGTRKGDGSVEECIVSTILNATKSKSYKFHAAGREDIDVRMLGSGRPFVLQCENPQKVYFSKEELKQIQEEVNKSTDAVQISNLRRITRKEFESFVHGQTSKRKSYRCVVWVSKKLSQKDIEFLNSQKELVIQQQTPIRVLHRRTFDTRPKTIHSIHCELINEHWMIVDLVTQAGT